MILVFFGRGNIYACKYEEDRDIWKRREILWAYGWFDDRSASLGYLMQNLSLSKNSSGTI